MEDCDEALVLLLHERARALETVRSPAAGLETVSLSLELQLWSLEGPADGIPSAELSPSEMDRVKQAHSCCKEEGRSSLGDSAIVSVFQASSWTSCTSSSRLIPQQELSRVCSQIRDSVAYLGPPATFTHQVFFILSSCLPGQVVSGCKESLWVERDLPAGKSSLVLMPG